MEREMQMQRSANEVCITNTIPTDKDSGIETDMVCLASNAGLRPTRRKTCTMIFRSAVNNLWRLALLQHVLLLLYYILYSGLNVLLQEDQTSKYSRCDTLVGLIIIILLLSVWYSAQ